MYEWPLQLIIDRVDTPIGEMIIIADHDGIFALSTGQIMGAVCCVYCSVPIGLMGSNSNRLKNPHGFADVIKRYFAGDLSALDTYCGDRRHSVST